MLNFSTMRWCEMIWPTTSGKSYVGEAGQVNEDWRLGKHLRRIGGEKSLIDL